MLARVGDGFGLLGEGLGSGCLVSSSDVSHRPVSSEKSAILCAICG